MLAVTVELMMVWVKSPATGDTLATIETNQLPDRFGEREAENCQCNEAEDLPHWDPPFMNDGS